MPNISSKVFIGPAKCLVCGVPLVGSLPGTWTFSTSKNFRAFYHVACLKAQKATPTYPVYDTPPPIEKTLTDAEWKALEAQCNQISKTTPFEPQITPTPKPCVKKTEHFCFPKLLRLMQIRRDVGHNEGLSIPGDVVIDGRYSDMNHFDSIESTLTWIEAIKTKLAARDGNLQ